MTGKKPVNVSLDATLVTRARELDVNVSQAAEEGLRIAVSAAAAANWATANGEAMDSSNAWIESRRLPLRLLRTF